MSHSTTALAEPRILKFEVPVRLVTAAAAPGWLRRGISFAGETLLLLAAVWSIPLVIIAIIIPFALCLRLLSWVFGGL
jgi:hypothetical protein